MTLNCIYPSQSQEILIDVYVYPDGEIYEEPPVYKSDDYEVRKQGFCAKYEHPIEPSYGEPFANCLCYTQEWYR